ncbi:WD40 repeat-containing protein SMU1 [Thelohanellus kitauei]|uniref:WD40 repeat-containing protein SMU1 n=1 Tax=Thelohanellus kitauei TaxID=669202 RepID=A0A0C2IUN5_THEKT|nr:WD40 repeat-containing protein SMU1 [Thelohanellus kitauei]
MIMENPVTSLVFGESDLLASGDSRGLIKVWRVETGQCVKRFDNAHNQSITCLLFSITKDHLFSGSTDCLIRCHSLKSGSILKEFSGHESFVNSICYSHDGHNLISTGSDGSIRVFLIIT